MDEATRQHTRQLEEAARQHEIKLAQLREKAEKQR